MNVTEKGRTILKRVFIGAIVIAVAIIGYVKRDSLSFMTKRVGEVKELKQSDYETDKVINAEVLETVDYKLPFRALPTDKRITVTGGALKLKGNGIMWNGAAAFAEANGGSLTTKGSYFEELGKFYKEPFFLELGRQDDYAAQQDELVTFTREYLNSGGKVTDKGNAFVWFMGDNGEAYFTQLNNKLKPLEKEFKLKEGSLYAETFLISGWSYGEDKAMGLAEWADDPKKALGAVFACYPLDGDQNLIIKWATDNGLLINPDGATYCPNAINFEFTDGFMEAAEAIGTKTGERLVVSIDPKTKKTVKTGESKVVEIQGCGTWYPGDELAFKKAKRLGLELVSLYSTYDNAHQMPCVITTVNIFTKDHPGLIDAIVEGTARAGDQMKTHNVTFQHAMGAVADVYKLKTPAEWAKAFKGFIETTNNGVEVKLGGCRTANLADNLDAFGIGDGSRATYQSSYELFGGYMHELYPKDLPNRLGYSRVVNTDPLTRVMTKMKGANEITASKKAEFETSPGKISTTVAKRSYSVEFVSGQATFTANGLAEMERMYNDLNTHDLLIQLSGHTDNVGSDELNKPLSKRRAEAVRNWLQNKNIGSFPSKRFESVEGYGSTQPVSDNSTADGKQRNRRVDIVVGH